MIKLQENTWKYNNTDWIKCHLITVIVFAILPLTVGLVVGLTINMENLIYPVPIIVFTFIAVKLFSLLIVYIIQKMINLFKRKKLIIIVSVLLHIAKSIIYMIPLIIMLLVDFFVKEYFNVFMILGIYVYYTIINIIVEYIYNKFFSQKNN